MPPKPGEAFALYTHTEPDEDGVYHVNLRDDYTHSDEIHAAQAFMGTPERQQVESCPDSGAGPFLRKE
jgi:hypothetical protein